MVYSFGWWDTNDGKGYSEHILTSDNFKDTGFCDYMGDLYKEIKMPEYIERFGGAE